MPIGTEVGLGPAVAYCTTSSKKKRLVVEVESLASSSKNKNMKSPRTFNKNSCDLLTAITHTKIMAAYFIISE